MTKHSPHRSKHDLYSTWRNMRRRCYGAVSGGRYLRRGIAVCPRWENDFWAFVEDMGPRPSRSHSIDRIDNSGPYAPGNCRWALPKQQARNRSNNVVWVVNGEEMCRRSALELLGVSEAAYLGRRGKHGASLLAAILAPSARRTPGGRQV